MASIGYLECCGVKEITDLSDNNSPEGALTEIKVAMRRGGRGSRLTAAHFIFTGVVPKFDRRDYAQEFRDLILKEKLGNVVETEVATNPNSKNPLRAYLWTPDVPRLFAWWKKAGRKYANDYAYNEGW